VRIKHVIQLILSDIIIDIECKLFSAPGNNSLPNLNVLNGGVPGLPGCSKALKRQTAAFANIQSTMDKRTLGKTGWAISVIGFGAIKLPLISRKECETLLY